MGRIRKEEMENIDRVCKESPFTSEPDPRPQDTAVERDIFSFWCVLSESIRSDIVVSLLEGFLGIIKAGGVRLASLKEQEAADEILLSTSGTIARMKTAPERSPSMNKSLLLLYRWFVNSARQVLRYLVFLFKK